MRLGLGLFLGIRAFRGRRGAGTGFLWTGSLALALGLVPLVVVLSVADGMIDSISSRTIETFLAHVQVWPLAGGSDLEARLATVPGLRAALPEQQGFALAYAPQGRLGVNLRGVDPRWAQDAGVRRYLKATEGSLGFPTPGSVWIGRETADKLGLHPGDTLKLLTTRTVAGVRVPRVTPLVVAAVVSVGYQELDKLWVFAPLETSRRLLDPAESPIFYGLKTDRPLAETAAFLADVRAAAGPAWQAVSWQTTGRSQFLNYQATRVLLLVVMALIVLVSSVNISTSMVTLAQQRRQDTAILKALGARVGLVRRQFLVLGLCAGLVGTAVGLGAGVALAAGINQLAGALQALLSFAAGVRGWLSGVPVPSAPLVDPAYYLETLPVKFDVPLLALVGAASVALAIVASLVPAWKASRQRPLEVLRRV